MYTVDSMNYDPDEDYSEGPMTESDKIALTAWIVIVSALAVIAILVYVYH